MNDLNKYLRYRMASFEARAAYAFLWAERREIVAEMDSGANAASVVASVLGVTPDRAGIILAQLRAARLIADDNGLTFLVGYKQSRVAAPSDSVDAAIVREALVSFTGSRRKLANESGCADSSLRSFAIGKGSLSDDVLGRLAGLLGCAERVRRGCAETAQTGCAEGAQNTNSARAESLSHSPSSLPLISSSFSSNTRENTEEKREEGNLKGGGVGEENLGAQTGCAEILRSAQPIVSAQSAQGAQPLLTHPSSEHGGPPKGKAPAEVAQVFDHWRTACNYPQAKLDPKRKRTIERALKSHGLEACLKAITGCTKSAWHMGDNPDGKRWNDVELILRDAKHIEQFLAPQSSPAPRQGQQTARMDYQGNRVTGAAPMPTTEDWLRSDQEEDEDDDGIEKRRARFNGTTRRTGS